MKLCFGTEQRLAAANTLIGALCLAILILAGEGRLRPFFACHIVLIWRELLLPLRFTLGNFVCHGSSEGWLAWLIPCYQIPQNPAGCNSTRRSPVAESGMRVEKRRQPRAKLARPMRVAPSGPEDAMFQRSEERRV